MRRSDINTKKRIRIGRKTVIRRRKRRNITSIVGIDLDRVLPKIEIVMDPVRKSDLEEVLVLQNNKVLKFNNV